MANRLQTTLDYVRQTLTPNGASPSDGQLLARFAAAGDECAFATLVRRHGPMVLGLCRRVLRHEQDAEDAFQATFLVLARKAPSVVKCESVGSWLYSVAYRTALQARLVAARRRAREKQVDAMPHPEVAPPEAQDWRPLLDAELTRLPEKYRAAVVLCDIEELSRREAARQLGLNEGTLSSRLATARRLLARRLARYGLAVSGGALASALAGGAARAALPAPLVTGTVRAAALVAAGQLAGLATPAGLLMKGVLTTMFVHKLKVGTAALMVAVALGATGLAYRAGGQVAAPARPDKPLSELEALRRENELLKLNLEVVLEKVRAQEAELRGLRGGPGKAKLPPDELKKRAVEEWRKVYPAASAEDYRKRLRDAEVELKRAKEALDARSRDLRRKEMDDAVREKYRLLDLAKKKAHLAGPDDAVRLLEEALKALKSAPDPTGQKRAVDALEAALQRLREKNQPKKPLDYSPKPKTP